MMKSNSQPIQTPDSPVLYTTKQVAKMFHVTVRTIQNWRDTGQISFIQINSVIVYEKQDVDELLLEYRRKRKRNMQ